MLRRGFLRNLAKDLCKQHMLSRVDVAGTPRLTKELICRILGVEMPQARRAPPPADIFQVTPGRCFKCDWRKNRPSKTRCAKCQFFICKEHAAPAQCIDCVQGEEEMEVDDE
ncbi:hypothetical protein J6590_084879 [Homalodisca vitripennis]|nr:hypothetical protein J6590_084879 [Homalodisca vitripennis]